jgi:hypothetical protein
VERAKARFHEVAASEVDKMVADGMDRPAALQRLMQRLRSEFVPVWGSVTCSRQLSGEVANHELAAMNAARCHGDDSLRALALLEEIKKLRANGYDTLAAIEELTARLTRLAGTKQAWGGGGGRGADADGAEMAAVECGVDGMDMDCTPPSKRAKSSS